MNSLGTLTITGTQMIPESSPISLDAGWNMISYLRNDPMPIETALASISENLILVRNNAGELYWPEYNYNTIADMEPGQGYQVYISSPDELIYPSND
jgi:hypothetical protein